MEKGTVLKVLSIVSALAGISTVIQAPTSKPCLLGYYAHCSFTPISTLICFIIAETLWWKSKRTT